MPVMSGWAYLKQYSKIKTDLRKHPRHYISTASINPKELTTGMKISMALTPSPLTKKLYRKLSKLMAPDLGLKHWLSVQRS